MQSAATENLHNVSYSISLSSLPPVKYSFPSSSRKAESFPSTPHRSDVYRLRWNTVCLGSLQFVIRENPRIFSRKWGWSL